MGAGNEDLGKLVNRACVSILMFFHGYHYLYGMTNVDSRIVAMGLPAVIGDAGQWIGEWIAPLAVLLGVYSRLGGALITIYMIVALLMAHTFGVNNHFFMLNDARPPDTVGDGYRLELQFFYLVGGLSVFLLGAGKYGLNIGGKWNN